MVRKPDATVQPTPQDNQLMSKHRVLSFKPQLRLEWRGEDGQNETEQPDHSASLGDSITSSTRIGVSVHTAVQLRQGKLQDPATDHQNARTTARGSGTPRRRSPDGGAAIFRNAGYRLGPGCRRRQRAADRC